MKYQILTLNIAFHSIIWNFIWLLDGDGQVAYDEKTFIEASYPSLKR